MKRTSEDLRATEQSRRPWQPPAVTRVGTVAAVIQNGGTKVTVVTGDPGEPRKPMGMDK